MRRTALISALVFVTIWWWGALVVVFAGPTAPSGRGSGPFGLWGRGPLFRWSGWAKPGGPMTQVSVKRGELDREHLTFPLSLKILHETAPHWIQEIGLATTNSSSLCAESNTGWREVARQRVPPDGELILADIPVDGRTAQYRLEFHFTGGTSGRFAYPMLMPSGLLERLHDTIGQWAVFRWLPAL